MSGGRVVYCGWFWHCSGLFWALFLALFCTVLSLALPYPGPVRHCIIARICTRRHWCSARTWGRPCPLPPRVHPCCTTLHHCHPGYLHRTGSGVRSGRGAQSWLQRWTDWLGTSPGLVHWPRLPADRHPHVTTLCHPGSALLGPLRQ